MNDSKLQIGSFCPDFELPGVDGRIHRLSDFSQASTLIIIFSCNHCPYVQAYEDRIIELQNVYTNVQFVAISANDAVSYPEDSFEEMQIRSTCKGFNFPYLYDETQAVAKKFGASFTPELFLFDSERKLRYTGKIDDNWKDPDAVTTKYLVMAIDELKSGKEISIPETYAIGCTIKWKI
ncbi:MAG: thioredoxin family protein [Ignavibacteria bacterium]|nr:thioredoxin family protein [Ignavibacteria bacterium]